VIIQRVLPARRHQALHSVASSRLIEQASAAALPPGTLMRRAGLAVARWVRALHPQARHIWVAAGPGGNGGDGLHAAAELAACGHRVTVWWMPGPAPWPTDIAEGRQRAQSAGVRWVEPDYAAEHDPYPADDPPDLALDALLGLGCSRAPTGPMALAVKRLQQLRAVGCPVLSVDVPSGMSADTGMAWGEPCVQADETLSLLTLKPGLFTGQGRALCGHLWFADLGSTSHWPVGQAASAWLSGGPWHEAQRTDVLHDRHKGSFGDVLIIGGAPGMLGAARLAAHAAQAAGAGRTLVSLLDPLAPSGDVTRPEWLWVDQAWRWEARDLARTTVVCGCGGGDAVADVLPALLAQTHALVLDADALNAIAVAPELQTLLADRASRGHTTVLTPHPLEAARLLGVHTQDIQRDRLKAAASLAERYRSVTLLKGSGSVICVPGQPAWVNSTGNAALAHGGSGDVLAGWIGGLMARWRGSPGDGGPTGVWALALRCTCAAAWLHGAAADQSPLEASRALDLVSAMHRLAGDGTALVRA
jgi:hydroxyethylthiazole kinase-like uncharacterized protein yjeF